MRWTAGHLVALVELACGVGVAAWLVLQGIAAEAAGAAGRSVLDRSVLFVLAAVVGGGLCAAAARSWRSAARESAAPSSAAGPSAAGPSSVGRSSVGPSSAAPSVPGASVRVSLSPEERGELARVVDVLAREGVFAPRPPDPAALVEAVADHGGPVTADVVLAALEEAEYHHPGFRLADHTANLAFHPSHGEQFAGTLEAQVADVRRLAAGGLDGVAVAVEIAGDGVSTRLRLVTGDDEQVLAYAGAVKYLSTVLHVALAGVLRERATGRRLAWLWSDQGVHLTGLTDGGTERLNTALGAAAGEGWEWVDEQPATSAGDPAS